MIKTSVSYGYGPENRYNLKHIPTSIQLAIYKYKIFENHKEQMFKELADNKTIINVIHLPLDFLRIDISDAINMIRTLKNATGCDKYVVHPNKNIKSFIKHFFELEMGWDVQLCIENFPWRKKKELRSPLEIIRECEKYRGDQLQAALTLDTSHTDIEFFEYKILSYILKYTSVIHLSNRKGKKQHLPFNMQNGDLNLTGFVKQLKRNFKWQGDIVLEYMPDFHHKLIPNHDYLKRLVE